MKYTHNYRKLQLDRYTTIRRYSKGKIGDITKEIYPSGFHYAKITDIYRRVLDDIVDMVLRDDTDCGSREEAYNLIQSFYQKPINFKKEKFYIYYLEKIK